MALIRNEKAIGNRMSHFEIEFKLQHDCPMTRISQRYPSAIIARWCQYESDVLEASYHGARDQREFRRDLQRAVEVGAGRVTQKEVTQSGLRIVAKCDNKDTKTSLTRFFVKHRCLELYPAIYTNGWEWYRMFALSGRNIKGFFDDLDRTCRVEFVSKKHVETGSMRDAFTISTAKVFGDLTEKQTKALQVAMDGGYYLVPKRASTKALAKIFSVTRTTFEEHLRKAESKVMQSLTPYVRFGGDLDCRELGSRNGSWMHQRGQRWLDNDSRVPVPAGERLSEETH